MRLLNANTLKLCKFTGNCIPPYAILSHRWGKDEVSLDEAKQPGFFDQAPSSREGAVKIKRFCELVRENAAPGQTLEGVRHVWVDTCCIDKSSSAELSEAINSMFKWYRDAKICFAHLADVSISKAKDTESRDEIVKRSEWFKRGWTLQELVAPRRIEFFDANWNPIGSRYDLMDLIEETAGIALSDLEHFEHDFYSYLRPGHRAYVSIARRMSWASKRVTTRPEDMAYCLLGLFNINMPLLYGEGSRKAFRRLQHEIIKQSDDESIFAWGSIGCYNFNILEESCLAPGPAAFGSSDKVVCNPHSVVRESYTMTNKGLHINCDRYMMPESTYRNEIDHNGSIQRTEMSLLPLNCSINPVESGLGKVLALPIYKFPWTGKLSSIPNFRRYGPLVTIRTAETWKGDLGMDNWIYVEEA